MLLVLKNQNFVDKCDATDYIICVVKAHLQFVIYNDRLNTNIKSGRINLYSYIHTLFLASRY